MPRPLDRWPEAFQALFLYSSLAMEDEHPHPINPFHFWKEKMKDDDVTLGAPHREPANPSHGQPGKLRAWKLGTRAPSSTQGEGVSESTRVQQMSCQSSTENASLSVSRDDRLATANGQPSKEPMAATRRGCSPVGDTEKEEILVDSRAQVVPTAHIQELVATKFKGRGHVSLQDQAESHASRPLQTSLTSKTLERVVSQSHRPVSASKATQNEAMSHHGYTPLQITPASKAQNQGVPHGYTPLRIPQRSKTTKPWAHGEHRNSPPRDSTKRRPPPNPPVSSSRDEGGPHPQPTQQETVESEAGVNSDANSYIPSLKKKTPMPVPAHSSVKKTTSNPISTGSGNENMSILRPIKSSGNLDPNPPAKPKYIPTIQTIRGSIGDQLSEDDLDLYKPERIGSARVSDLAKKMDTLFLSPQVPVQTKGRRGSSGDINRMADRVSVGVRG